tara:strand:- start:2216 stop:2875 length:660 start_codon:yes stop_codon:yes gene_type:complete
MKYGKIWKIAHRGFIQNHPHNSIPAFHAAIKQGFDMIELDLQLCLQNKIIVHHDRHIGGFPIESLRYEQIKMKVPELVTLDEFFKEFPNYKNLKLYFDLKGKEQLASILKKYIVSNNINTQNIYIGSFNINHLLTLKETGAKLGFITCSKYTVTQYCDLIRKLHFISVDKSILDTDVVNICRGLNKKIFVFTCKDQLDENYIRMFDVDGIVSNIKLDLF